MSAPAPAWLALAWVAVGVPLVLIGTAQARRGHLSRHRALMLAAVAVELAVVLSFSLVEVPSPRRPALQATLYYQVHVALAVGTLVGLALQVATRAVPPLRPLHRRLGRWVAAVWCLALLTGAGNFVHLYGMS